MLDISSDRTALERAARSPSLSHRIVMRSRIVLLLGEGRSAREVMNLLQVSRRTVDLWRARYREGGFAALTHDKPGKGSKAKAR